MRIRVPTLIPAKRLYFAGKDFNSEVTTLISTHRSRNRVARLLDRQALRQIARLIDVRALQHSHMVGKELQRNREDDGSLQRGRRRGHLDNTAERYRAPA